MKTSETINELAKALAAAQGEMKNATLNRVNPHFKNRYADLAAIRDAVVPAMSKHGLAVTQTTDLTDAGFLLTTRVSHLSGQWMESVYPLAVNPNPQAMGSQLTYARRYSLSAIAGISADEDDDAEIATANKPANGNGHAVASGKITADQAKAIRSALVEAEADEVRFASYMGVKTIEEIPAAGYARAMESLGAKKAKVARAGKAA